MFGRKNNAKKKNNTQYDPVANNQGYTDENNADFIFCVECGAKNQKDSGFCIQCGAKIEKDEPVYPTLTLVRTEESYTIDKPEFRIGADPNCCALVISDNNYISRNHAEIIKKDNKYYIMDLNSKNKTFVNGEEITADKEVEIFSGTQIKLANEEFIFN